MGYDLYWENQPDNVKAEVLKHPDVVREARDCGENSWHASFISEALSLMDKHKSYQHWNITGMGWLRGLMRQVGMTHDDLPPGTSSNPPTLAEFGVVRTATGAFDQTSPEWQLYLRAYEE